VVHLLVSRRPDHVRWCPEALTLDPQTGVEKDAWGRKLRPDPEAMVTVMRRDVAELIANGQSLELFGDNLIVDYDLSEEWLPVGTEVEVGPVRCVVTTKPHRGCGKFKDRFGADALAFVNAPDLRHHRLRGVYLRVVEGGLVSRGDALRRVDTPTP